MPFTISHAIAAVPLARAGRGRLSPAALAIGTMVPDLPYFVPPHVGAGLTHAAYGPVTVDLGAGLLVFVVWRALREPFLALCPPALGERVGPAPRLTRTGWLWVAVSVVLGAVTHVFWDTFTHPRRWGTTHIPALTSSLGPLAAYKWLQYGSGVLGLLALAVWAWVWLSRRPRTAAVHPTPARVRRVVWAVVGVVLVVTAVVSAAIAQRAGGSLEATAVAMATGSIGATTAAVLLSCLAWRLVVRPGSGRARAPQGPADRGHP